jgi:hypothetical protein
MDARRPHEGAEPELTRSGHGSLLPFNVIASEAKQSPHHMPMAEIVSSRKSGLPDLRIFDADLG